MSLNMPPAKPTSPDEVVLRRECGTLRERLNHLGSSKRGREYRAGLDTIYVRSQNSLPRWRTALPAALCSDTKTSVHARRRASLALKRCPDWRKRRSLSCTEQLGASASTRSGNDNFIVSVARQICNVRTPRLGTCASGQRAQDPPDQEATVAQRDVRGSNNQIAHIQPGRRPSSRDNWRATSRDSGTALLIAVSKFGRGSLTRRRGSALHSTRVFPH